MGDASQSRITPPNPWRQLTPFIAENESVDSSSLIADTCSPLARVSGEGQFLCRRPILETILTITARCRRPRFALERSPPHLLARHRIQVLTVPFPRGRGHQAGIGAKGHVLDAIIVRELLDLLTVHGTPDLNLIVVKAS